MSIYEHLSDAAIEVLLTERAGAQRCRLAVDEHDGRWVAAFVENRRFRRKRSTLMAEKKERRAALLQLLKHSDHQEGERRWRAAHR